MSTTITAISDGTTATPQLVLGYETTRESRNIVHDLISGGIGVSLIEPRPRSGTLELFFLTEAEAFAALDLHARESAFSITSEERSGIDMSYVIDGDVSLALDEEGRQRWVLSVGYQEVIL